MKKQMKMVIDESISPNPDSGPFGKDEMNFAENPIALLSDKAPKGQKSIEFEDEVYDEKRKRIITRRRIIEGSEKYGLPTATDDLVVLGLIQLSKLKGHFKSREVSFTRLELIKLLGWTTEGKSYERIKTSLLRIQAVNYIYDNAWWDKRVKGWTTKAFHLIDNVEINDSRTSGDQGGLFASRILWNEVVFDSFQSGFLRDIDFALCLKLEHPTALRMYRFLGKRFYHRTEQVFDLKEFAYNNIGLGRNYEGGAAIARKLRPAIAELEKYGFLEPLPEDQRFIKKSRNWSIRFIQKAEAAPAEPDALPALEIVQNPLVTQLVSRGVTTKVAVKLVDSHAGDFLGFKIDVFDWLVETKNKAIAKNAAGYLVKSIKDDYAAPEKFVPKAERLRRLDIEHAKSRDLEEQRQAATAARAAEEARFRKAEDLWKALTEAEQRQLEVDALSAAPEESRSTYASLRSLKGGKLGGSFLMVLCREVLLSKMESPESSEPA